MRSAHASKLFLLALFVGGLAAAGEGDSSRPKVLKGESIYQLSDKWETQDGKKVALSSLAGLPVVIAMAYTACESACPMTISDLKRIEAALPPGARSKVRFAVFSFDAKRDLPGNLAKYAKARELDPARWTLFHGSKSAVRKLAAVLGIRYKEDASGNFDHSNAITLVDADGVILRQTIGLGGDGKEIVKDLAKDLVGER